MSFLLPMNSACLRFKPLVLLYILYILCMFDVRTVLLAVLSTPTCHFLDIVCMLFLTSLQYWGFQIIMIGDM